MRFENKTAIVTGASRGIGFETARQLALRGADLAICATKLETAQEAARKIADETGRVVHPFQTNVADTVDFRIGNVPQTSAGCNIDYFFASQIRIFTQHGRIHLCV